MRSRIARVLQQFGTAGRLNSGKQFQSILIGQTTPVILLFIVPTELSQRTMLDSNIRGAAPISARLFSLCAVGVSCRRTGLEKSKSAAGQGVRRGMRPVTLSFAGIRVLPREARRRQGVDARVAPGGNWTRWREKGRGVWAGCGEMFGFWGAAAEPGVRDGGGCGRMGDGKCPFGAMISGGETWKDIFLKGGVCVR